MAKKTSATATKPAKTTEAKPTAGEINAAAPASSGEAKPSGEGSKAGGDAAAPSATEILAADKQATAKRIRSSLLGKDTAKPAKKKERPAPQDDSDDDAIDIETGEIGSNLGEDDGEDDHAAARRPEKKAAKAPESPKAGKLSDALIEQAQEAGIPLSLVRQAGSDDLLKGMIALAQRPESEPRQRRRDDSVDDENEEVPDPAPKKVAPKAAVETNDEDSFEYKPVNFDDFIKENEFNETTTSIIKKLEGVINDQGSSSAKTIAALKKELADTRAKADGVENEVRTERNKAIDSQINECFKTLPQSLQDVYGTIETRRLPAGSAAAKARSRMIQVMGTIQQARQNAGLEQLDIPKLFERAKRELHEDVVESEVEDRVRGRITKTIERKQHQEVLRPSSRRTGSDDEARAKAVEGINRALKNNR